MNNIKLSTEGKPLYFRPETWDNGELASNRRGRGGRGRAWGCPGATPQGGGRRRSAAPRAGPSGSLAPVASAAARQRGGGLTRREALPDAPAGTGKRRCGTIASSTSNEAPGSSDPPPPPGSLACNQRHLIAADRRSKYERPGAYSPPSKSTSTRWYGASCRSRNQADQEKAFQDGERSRRLCYPKRLERNLE